MLAYPFILFPLMKKYVGQRLTSYWLAINLGNPPVVGQVMMLLPANANAGPPFYPPARFFAYSEIGGVSH